MCAGGLVGMELVKSEGGGADNVVKLEAGQ